MVIFMSDATPETGIQDNPPLNPEQPRATETPEESLPPRRITVFAGMLFGASAGVPISGLVAAMGAWLADQYESAWLWALTASPLGMIIGGVTGAVDRIRHSDVVEPNIGTWTGILIGLIPAVACLAATIGITGGTFLLFVAAGFVFIGPTVGLLIGASLDHAYSEARAGRLPSTILRVAITLAACFCLVPAIEWIMTPSLETVEKDARKAFVERLRVDEANPQQRRIRKVALTYLGSRKFVGEIHAGPLNDTTIWDVTIIHRGGYLQMESVPREK